MCSRKFSYCVCFVCFLGFFVSKMNSLAKSSVVPRAGQDVNPCNKVSAEIIQHNSSH